MISPELLRRYEFFACLSDAQQKAVAMVAEVVAFKDGAVIFREGDPATSLYLLTDGGVALTIAGTREVGRQLFVGDANPGEVFGISAGLDGQKYTSSAQATAPSKAIKLNAPALHALTALDCSLGFCMMRQMTRVALERLQAAYVELAAAQT